MTTAKIKNTGLSATCVLATVNIRQSSFRKLDREATAKTNEAAGADDSAGRFNKLLIDKNAFKPISQLVTKMRTYHMVHTLPYSDSGPRLLTTMSYFEYCQKMADFKDEFNTEVGEFISRYDEYVSHQSERLGNMFNPDDYPSAEVVRNKFSVHIDISPVPSTSTLGDLAGIPQEELDSIAEKVKNNESERTESAMRDLWDRLYTAVSAMRTKLSTEIGDDGSTFRDSLVGNLGDLVDLLPSLNLTADKNLEAMYRAVETNLCTADVKELRQDPIAREVVANDAQKILNAMENYF